MANLLGTGMLIGQELKWKEQRIILKFSSHYSDYAQYRPQLLGSNFSERILKDYNGQTYWLSGNLNSFFKDKNRIPKWLNLAIGYSAEGMIGGNRNPTGELYPVFDRYRQLFFSLDVDLTRIKTKSKFLNTALGTFGFIKFPMPTLEFSQNKMRFHSFYF